MERYKLKFAEKKSKLRMTGYNAVADYINKKNPDYDDMVSNAFKKAGKDRKAAMASVVDQLAEMGFKKNFKDLKIKFTGFEDFDSSNINHAVAYFSFEITGEEQLIQDIERKY